MTNKIKLVEMKSSNMVTKTLRNRPKRDVETAIKETNTRTELCVQYSLSSVNTNVQTDHTEPMSETEYMGKVVQKLHLARKILNPVIDEIITTATIMSETELTAASNAPLCSLSKTEYQGALRASQIFNEINQELVRKYNNRPLVVGKNFRFPLTKPITIMACYRNKSRNAVEVKDRIYIDKDLMLKLIELYEMLGETIKRLKKQQSSQRSIMATSTPQKQTSVQAAESMSDVTRYSESSDESLTTSEIVVKAALKKKTVDQIYQKETTVVSNKVANLFESPRQAQERAANCLKTLSDVQAYLEVTRGGDVDLLNLFEVVQKPDKCDCNYKGLPHLHATLNGIPVILVRSDSSKPIDMSLISKSLMNKSEKSVQDSLISQSFINNLDKPVQDSNYKFSSAQYSMEEASYSLISSLIVKHSYSSSSSCCSCACNCTEDNMECVCITTSSYLMHEAFSASGEDTSVVTQSTESNLKLSSPTSQDRVETIISSKNNFISSPHLESSSDRGTLHHHSDTALERNDMSLTAIEEVLNESSTTPDVARSTSELSTLSLSVVSAPSGIKSASSSKTVKTLQTPTETTLQPDVSEESDFSVTLVGEEAFPVSGVKTSTVSQNIESVHGPSSLDWSAGSIASENKMESIEPSKSDKVASTSHVKVFSNQHATTMESDDRPDTYSKDKILTSAKDIRELPSSILSIGSTQSENEMKTIMSTKPDQLISTPQLRSSPKLSAQQMQSDTLEGSVHSKNEVLSSRDVTSHVASQNLESVPCSCRCVGCSTSKTITKSATTTQAKTPSSLPAVKIQLDVEGIGYTPGSHSKSKELFEGDATSTTASQNADSTSTLSSHRSATVGSFHPSTTVEMKLKAATSSKIDQATSAPHIEMSLDLFSTVDTGEKSDTSDFIGDSYSKDEVVSVEDIKSPIASRNVESTSGLSSHKSIVIGQSGTSEMKMKASTSSKMAKMSLTLKVKPDTSGVVADSYSKNEVTSAVDKKSSITSRKVETLSGLSSHRSVVIGQPGASAASEMKKKASKSSKTDKIRSTAQVKSNTSDVIAGSYSKNEVSAVDAKSTTASRNAESISGLSSHKSATADQSGTSVTSDTKKKAATSSRIEKIARSPEVKAPSFTVKEMAGRSDVSDIFVDSYSKDAVIPEEDFISCPVCKSTISKSAILDESGSKAAKSSVRFVEPVTHAQDATTSSKTDKIISTPLVASSSKKMQSSMTGKGDLSKSDIDEFYKNGNFVTSSKISSGVTQDTKSVHGLSDTGQSIEAHPSENGMKTIMSRKVEKTVSTPLVEFSSDQSLRRVQSDMTDGSNISFRVIEIPRSTSEIAFGSRGQINGASAFGWVGSDLYEDKPPEIRKGPTTSYNNGKILKITDLIKVAKPAKCCRKSYLNEPLRPAVPYPVSLLSLHLDDNDKKLIEKRIKTRAKSDKESQMAYCTCIDRDFRIEQRIFIPSSIFYG